MVKTWSVRICRALTQSRRESNTNGSHYFIRSFGAYCDYFFVGGLESTDIGLVLAHEREPPAPAVGEPNAVAAPVAVAALVTAAVPAVVAAPAGTTICSTFSCSKLSCNSAKELKLKRTSKQVASKA